MESWLQVNRLTEAQEEWASWAVEEVVERYDLAPSKAPHVRGGVLHLPPGETADHLLGLLDDAVGLPTPPASMPQAGRRLATKIRARLRRDDSERGWC